MAPPDVASEGVIVATIYLMALLSTPQNILSQQAATKFPNYNEGLDLEQK